MTIGDSQLTICVAVVNYIMKSALCGEVNELAGAYTTTSELLTDDTIGLAAEVCCTRSDTE